MGRQRLVACFALLACVLCVRRCSGASVGLVHTHTQRTRGCAEAEPQMEVTSAATESEDSSQLKERSTDTLRSNQDSAPTLPIPKPTKPHKPKKRASGKQGCLSVVHNVNFMHHEGPIKDEKEEEGEAQQQQQQQQQPSPAVGTAPRVNCKWGEWDTCSATCGGGTQTRSMVTDSGAQCPTPKSELRKCNAQACPKSKDCAWGKWADWGSCSVTCGGGTQIRTRQKEAASSGGKDCSGVSQQKRACGTKACPRDCEWSQWSQWGQCSKSCGGGKQTRSRSKRVVEAHGGNCLGKPSETRVCALEACPQKRDCKWSPWSKWSACSARCKGLQMRTRRKLHQAHNGGAECKGLPVQKRHCGAKTCKRECVLELGTRRHGGGYKAGSSSEHMNSDRQVSYGAKACWEDCYKTCLEHEECEQAVWFGGAGGHCFPVTASYDGKEADPHFNSAVCFGSKKE